MPLYEYRCRKHGAFDVFRPVSQASERMGCPSCGEDAARVFSVPHTRALAAGTRVGMERNEKSRHEPHVCGSGCGHGHARKPRAAPGKLHNYTGPRPWVVEHA